MRKTVVEAYSVERNIENITYKNLFVVIATILGFLLLGGLFLGLAFGIYGEEALRDNLEGYYFLLIDAAVVAIVLLAYKPVLHFIKYIWDVSVLKNGKTYLYLLIGFIVIALSQYLMLHVFSFESAAEQKKQLGSLGIQNSIQSIIYVLSVAIITPVKEEILFRGILYRFLEKKYNFLVGIIISSFIFGILHGGLLITATIMGMVFAMLYKKTQSIIPSIILHIAWNLLVSISMIVSL
ncbi:MULTISPECIES: CPBP family intramembrane glutamic endopeptidase [unclassified Bacillus (in: firmicutes)]|uniref:CPBP family intramembrane glutamic endopeptidase n=1 Tax=unclassified Bacillus (in: firmicutes) TaxID=185979 RepID=UPI0023D9AB10|nr:MULTISPECIES: CPBP family intramembrane glutamic endopeptidase [unclassified Bacillus (in: firmicutes)]MDF2018293.1 CPBP family intramembrane metalloprotease [Bacillus sp. Cr_R3]MDF2031026.1 CPBP family intramembrane metalloprotease [Bacillus sp. Cr_R16]